MSYIQNFRLKINQFLFLRELKLNQRVKSVCNIDEAKSIGILYDATLEENSNSILLYEELLDKKKSNILLSK